MSPEQKAKIDTASESELWRMLSCAPSTDAETLYVRERLAQKSQTEANQKLDEISRRLTHVEQAAHRSSLGTPTFWLALLAVLFSSFAVPWDEVTERMETWRQKASADWRRTSPRPTQSWPNQSDSNDASHPNHEPALPQNPSSAPPAASPLFPQ